MQEFYQSNLLQSLGWAITDSLWQMSLLWMVYQLGIAPLFKNKPAVRHLAALVALFAGTIWFLISFFQRLDSAPSLASIAVYPVADNISLAKYLVTLLPYFSFAYLTVLILLLIRLVFNILSTQKLRVELIPSIEWQHVVNRLTVQMGLSRDIFIYLSEQINVPSTIGYLKPIILLPIASLNQLSVEQVESVIMHEMAHIRRNDYLINLMVAFVETILFFNPFAHLLSKAVRKECELCCDDDVLKQQLDPQEYAQALLLLERARLKPAFALAATGKQSLLLGRVKRILNMPDQDIKYRNKLAALVAVAGLVMLTGLLTPTKTSSADQIKDVAVVATTHEAGPLLMAKSPSKVNLLPTTPAKKPLQKNTRKKPQTVQAPPTAMSTTPPPPPPAPPFETVADEDFKQIWVYPSAGSPSFQEAPAGTRAPDPRDRRHPDILRNAERDLAMHPEIMNMVREGINLEKMIVTEKKKKVLQGIYERNEEPNVELDRILFEQSIAVDPAPRIQMKKVKTESLRKITTPVMPRVQTFNKEKEMTIRIIQDDEQIEITVKDRK